jgi:magnesium transporter
MEEPKNWLCFRFDPATSRTTLIPPYLAAPDKMGEGRVWVDVCAPTHEDTEELGRLFGFHPLALSDLLNDQVRPKQEMYEDVLFTVFGAIHMEGAQDAFATINLNIFLTGQYIVTTHSRPLRTVTTLHQALIEEAPYLNKGTDHVFYLLIDGIVDRYLDVMADFEEDIEEMEHAIFTEAPQTVQEDLFRLKRKLANVRRSILPKRETVRTLVYRESEYISPETQTHLRDVLDHVLRINDNLETYREVLNSLMDSYMTRLSTRTNEIMKMLSVIATLMMPLSFITGIFGMNFQYLPMLQWKYGFWALAVFMLSIVGGMLYYFHKRKIL